MKSSNNTAIEQSVNNSSTVTAETESEAKLMFKCQNKDLDPVLVMVYRVLPPMIDCTAYCDDGHLYLNLYMSSFDPNNQDSKSDWRELVGKCLDRLIARGNSSPCAWWNVSSKIVNAVWDEGDRRDMYWEPDSDPFTSNVKEAI